jgi:hypothetical protein
VVLALMIRWYLQPIHRLPSNPYHGIPNKPMQHKQHYFLNLILCKMRQVILVKHNKGKRRLERVF